jgi:hypothetical protein
VKVEYVNIDSSECPLIRIFGGSNEDYVRLHKSVEQLSSGTTNLIILNQIAGFESVNNCSVTLHLDSQDLGIRRVGLNNFEWILTKDGWSKVEGFIEPFLEVTISQKISNSYQWLQEKDQRNSISLLLSTDGAW